MRRILIVSSVFAGLLLASVGAHAQQPSIAANGVLNGASYALPGLPNAGIAQGAIFIVFGQNLGPATLVQVSSFPLPTSQGLAGTSVRVTVGGTSVDAIMLYASAGQVAAVLPSNTPLGTGTLTVTRNNVTSTPAPITVVRSSFGTFSLNQAGSGPGVMQVFNSESDQPFNTISSSARPGQVIILWGTGLGPVTGNEAGQPLPGDMTSLNLRVWVGAREARVLYRGRSGCCVGIDQISFEVPQGVEGCYVPVSIQIGDVISNFTSLSVSSSGGVCSDPNGFSGSDLEIARTTGNFRLGSISLSRSASKFSIPGQPVVDIQTDYGAAVFYSYNFDQLTRSQGLGNSVSIGACSISTFRTSGQGGGASDPIRPVGLDAGAAINVSGPRGPKQLVPTAQSLGLYSAQLSGPPTDPFGGGGTPYLDPGAYTFDNGSGGSAVGAFRTTHTMPAALTWTNEAAITVVTRSQGVLLTWSGGDPNSFVYISGSSFNTTNNVGAAFVCLERASVGSFTVPSGVLLALPAAAAGSTFPTGSLSVGGVTTPSRFNAPGLDAGYVTATSFTSKSVNYQ